MAINLKELTPDERIVYLAAFSAACREASARLGDEHSWARHEAEWAVKAYREQPLPDPMTEAERLRAQGYTWRNRYRLFPGAQMIVACERFLSEEAAKAFAKDRFSDCETYNEVSP